jgi:hypothetical protein
MAAPPFEWQVTKLREFLPKGMELPSDLTFGKAVLANAAIRDIRNTKAIAEMKLEEGQIWRWYTKGRRSPYVYVWRIYGGSEGHKVRLRAVELSRESGETRAKVRASQDYFTAHPSSMQVMAVLVDLTTWQPPEPSEPEHVEVDLGIDLDDLPF